MSKLSKDHSYWDISDFIRPITTYCVKKISKYSFVNAIRITTVFIVVGILGAYFILNQSYLLGALCLQLKNFLDAADGEWARQNNRPSYVGRYYDSFGDFICNVCMHYAIFKVTNASLLVLGCGVLFSHLQVSLNVYYNLIYIHQCKESTVLRWNESVKPNGYEYDNKFFLSMLHILFKLIYAWQDRMIQFINKRSEHKRISKSFMSFISVLGLGAQLLLTSLLLVFNCIHLYWIINIFGLSIIACLSIVIRWVKKDTKLICNP